MGLRRRSTFVRSGGGALRALRALGSDGERIATPLKLFLWVRYPHVLIPAYLAILTGRWVSGRVMLRKRATDATFVHRARAASGGWWAERAGWVRHVARMAPLYALIAWAKWGAAATVALIVCGSALAGWWGLRRWREHQHDKTWLWPMWPAIARVLGRDVEGAPPRSWVELPADPRAEDAEVVIGLPPSIGDDRAVVTALRVILDQRLDAGRWTAHPDGTARLVRFTHRPTDPTLWPAVASVLRLDPSEEIAGDWLTLPRDAAADDARVVIQLPNGLPDDRRVVDALRELVAARLPGEWSTRAALTERVVALVRRHPAPAPPRMAPGAGVPEFAARFGGGLPNPEDLEAMLSGRADGFEPADDPASDPAAAELVEDEPAARWGGAA